METDQEFVEFIIKALVDNPADVRTDRTVDEMGVLITLHINPADMGQVIGRQGATAKSIRTLLRVIGARNNARVNLKVKEPEGSTRGHRSETPAEGTPAEAAATPVAEQPKQSVEEAIDDLKL